MTAELVHATDHTTYWATDPHECTHCHKMAYVFINQGGDTWCVSCVPHARRKP